MDQCFVMPESRTWLVGFLDLAPCHTLLATLLKVISRHERPKGHRKFEARMAFALELDQLIPIESLPLVRAK
jgi:hypothetical protein